MDDAKGLREFIDRKSLDNSDFLNDFIRTEHIGGIIVTDNKLNIVSQANMDNKNLYDLWKKVLEKKYIKNLIKYPKKSFIGNVMLKKIPYLLSVLYCSQFKGILIRRILKKCKNSLAS